MKRIFNFMFIAIMVIGIFTGCSPQPALGSLVSVQGMVDCIAAGDIERAMYPIYSQKADPELKENMQSYSELIGGRDVLRCDCVNYNIEGDAVGPNDYEDYEEMLQFEIMLEDETVLYAESVYIEDGDGIGIITFEMYEECPW